MIVNYLRDGDGAGDGAAASPGLLDRLRDAVRDSLRFRAVPLHQGYLANFKFKLMYYNKLINLHLFPLQ